MVIPARIVLVLGICGWDLCRSVTFLYTHERCQMGRSHEYVRHAGWVCREQGHEVGLSFGLCFNGDIGSEKL